jgi:hypothetical protein
MIAMVWRAARAMEGNNPEGTVAQSLVINWNVRTVTVTGRVDNRPVILEPNLDALFLYVSDPANGFDYVLREELISIAEVLGPTLRDLESERLRHQAPPEYAGGFRNVYGFTDRVTMMVPAFDMKKIAPLLVGAHRLAKRTVHQSFVSQDTLCRRMRRYAALLHLVHHFSLAEQDIWPDDLVFGLVTAASQMKKIPRKMANFAIMRRLDRDDLSAPNWQVLESSLLLRSASNRTAYVGFQVDGTWFVDSGGRASVSGSSTCYPALEAAIRDVWNGGATVHVAERLMLDFRPIRSYNNTFNPLGISPRAFATGSGRMADITVAVERGIVSTGNNKGGTMLAIR